MQSESLIGGISVLTVTSSSEGNSTFPHRFCIHYIPVVYIESMVLP